MSRSIAEQKAKLSQNKARAEREIYQLQNKQKILLNRIRGEERRVWNHRLIQHGLILEGVFPAAINTDGEAVKSFLIALSRLPGAQELVGKTLNGGAAE